MYVSDNFKFEFQRKNVYEIIYYRGSSTSSLSSGSNSKDISTLWGSSSSSRVSSSHRGPTTDSRGRYTTLNSNNEYHVQSHLFRELESDSRYEVIVQTRNSFGWSRPTKSFIFSTRDKGTYCESYTYFYTFSP